MFKIIIFGFSILLFFSSCKKETGVAGPAGAAGTNGQDGIYLDTGTISGNLAVYNEFSWPLTDSSGVTVSMNQNGISRTATSDASGNYSFLGVPAGTYNLSYQKPNFGTMKVFGVSHTPGTNQNTIVPEVYVIQTPVRTAIDSVRLDSGYSYVVVHIYLDTSSATYVQYQYNFALLIGTNANPDLTNTTLSPFSEFIAPDGNGAYTVFIDRSNLGGINPTNPYYINVGTFNRFLRAYKNPYSAFDVGAGGYYVDPSDGKFVFPNLKMAPKAIKVK